MPRYLLTLTALVGITLLAACGQPQDPDDNSPQARGREKTAFSGGTSGGSGGSGGGGGMRMALIDLDEIAREMGWYEELRRRVGATEQELHVKLQGLRVQLETMLRDEQKRMGEPLTQEQQDRLAAMRMVAQRKLDEAQAQVRQESERVREEAIAHCHELVRPIAMQIAKARGVGILLLPTNQVFWHDAAVDLTDPIVQELKRANIKLSLAAPPAPGNAPETPENNDAPEASPAPNRP